MKRVNYALILPLVVVSGLVFASREGNRETAKKPTSKPLSAAEMKAGRVAWEATPDGINFKKWEASPAGKKVYAAEAKIMTHINASTNMEAIVTSLSLPPGSRVGFGVMVRINNEDYILTFPPEKLSQNYLNFSNEFRLLHTLKINDKIIIRSHSVSHAPKYSYPILSGEYVERDSLIIFNRPPNKNGC